MRIAFVDFANWDYTIETAYSRPLGGSQSALCYLAEQLAASGNDVCLLNQTAGETGSRGVRCLPLNQVTPDKFQFDVVIVLNAPRDGAQLRQVIGPECALLLWIQHADDQPASQTLAVAEVRDAYDGFVFVSRWQRQRFVEQFDIANNLCMTMRNAVGPTFATLMSPENDWPADKLWPPTLVYTSTPFRGLDLLVAAFPAIRQAIPEAQLKIFSSMKVYQADAATEAKFADLYEQCHTTEGVDYIGSVPQPQLAAALQDATMLAYPNHFAETSCIAVAEALAAGCQVVTSDLGALPETTAGLARLVPVYDDWSRYLQDFVTAVVEELSRIEADPSAAEQRLRQQATTMQQSCTWPLRAEQWTRWLSMVQDRLRART